MKHTVFIGQAPAKPSSKHEVPGTYLHAWLHSIQVSDSDIKNYCHFFALTNIFPGSTAGGHLPPTKEQVHAHLPILRQAIQAIHPHVIVPVGKMAITEVMGVKNVSLENVIGQEFRTNPFQALSEPIPCIPLSHPSGRSTWNHTHQAQLQHAFLLLERELHAVD